MQNRSPLEIVDGSQATMTVLSVGASPDPVSVTIRRAVAGREIEVATAAPLAPEAAVRLDVNGGMVLAEVLQCRRSESEFVLELKIDQVIPSLSELASLMQAVMAEGSGRSTQGRRARAAGAS